MKAIFYSEYGPPDVLHFVDVEKPVPKDDEVLIRIHTASVNAVIDRCYALRDAADAIRYIEQGHAKGKIVITVIPDGAAVSVP